MNLKEAFRFQNKLQSMMADAQSILGNNGNITKVQNTYLRHKVMAEAEDEVTMEAPSTEYSENITEMAEFLLFLLDEREKLSAAIHQAKGSLPLGAGLDGEVSLNGKRQEIATLLRHMAGLRNGEVLISNGGVGYRFNNEGTALYLTYRQPEVCSLCGSGKRERYQAPVILNLTTGQSNEMRIYDPDLPLLEYEIAPIQTTGTFSFASCAGYTGRRDTCSHTCTVDLPIETKGLKVSHFCSDCRVLLKDHAENGFVMADLYVEDAIDIYPVTVGADYTIRDYRITVSETKVRSEMELIVLGIAEGLTFVD